MFLAENRVPTWPTLFDQVLEEEGGIAFAGVCSSLQAALRLKELYEDETVTQYRAKSTVATFGQTEFQRTALRRATFRLMDVRLYTPIFILAKNRYVCHKGPDIDRGLKEKRKRANLSVDYISVGDDDPDAKGSRSKKRKGFGGSGLAQVSKRPRHSQLTKKVGCPATLTMYEVLIANCEDADFDDELSWKVRIATQKIDLERFIVVFLPRFHEGHEIGHSSASCVSRSWHPDVRAKLTSLLIDGVRDPDDMMTFLKQYVETDLCVTYTTMPNADDRRYYPLRTDIRNAIAYDLKEKKIFAKPDEDSLMELFQHWADVDPDGRLLYRPNSLNEVKGLQNLLLVYQSSDQHHLMQRYGTELIFVDESTAYGVPVIFLSVKTNCIYHVVAYFLLSVSTIESISEGLETVKNWNPGVEPRYVMCDQDEKHFVAVESTWPSARLLLCDYCREQDWTQWINHDETDLQQKQYCKQEILTLIRQIADSNSQEELIAAQHRLLRSKSFKSSPQVDVYYTKQYLPVIERWVQYYRRGLHTRIDASNAHERRDGPMRQHFQPSSAANYSLNVIAVISAIRETVDGMWQDYCKANVAQATAENNYKFEGPVSHLANRPHDFCNVQLKAYHKAKHFLQVCADVSSYFKKAEDDAYLFLVKDFNSANEKWHRLELSSSSGDPYCSCSTFRKHKMPCQHFYAVFAVFEDVSWYSLPAGYRDLGFFTLDPRCLQSSEEGSGHFSQAVTANSDSQSARSMNMFRLTGLLDKIKASAASVDDQSLTRCVHQVEEAATLVKNATPAGKHSADGRSFHSSSVSVAKEESCQPGSAVEPGSDDDNEVERSTTGISSVHGPVKKCVSHKSSKSNLQSKQTVDSQRMLQRQYATTAVLGTATEETDTSPGDVWIQLGDIVLSRRHKAMISEELDDCLVMAALALLKAEDHDEQFSGLIAPSTLASLQFDGRHDQDLIQIMKVTGEIAPRWICVSTLGSSPSAVDVYDCAFPSTLNEEEMYSQALKLQIAALLTLPLDQKSVTLHSNPVIQREGALASGLFAVAFATDLIYYRSVVGILDQKSLASHLESCLCNGCLIPFPKLEKSERAISAFHWSPPFTIDVPVFCKCRLPCSERRNSDEDLMVKCSAENCPIQWYHLRCVGSADSEQNRLRHSSWYCDQCVAAMDK